MDNKELYLYSESSRRMMNWRKQKIKYGETIDLDTIKELCESNISDFNDILDNPEHLKKTEIYGFWIETQCPFCGKIQKTQQSRFNTIQILNNASIKNDINEFSICNNCKNNTNTNLELQRIQEKENNTTKYIKEFLAPYRRFLYKFLHKNPNAMMGYGWDIDYDLLQKVILGMPYREFINTKYWKGIRYYKLERANYRCEKCHKRGTLHVHHKTYENHGKEHDFDVANNDLIVLCKKCHEEIHGMN